MYRRFSTCYLSQLMIMIKYPLKSKFLFIWDIITSFTRLKSFQLWEYINQLVGMLVNTYLNSYIWIKRWGPRNVLYYILYRISRPSIIENCSFLKKIIIRMSTHMGHTSLIRPVYLRVDYVVYGVMGLWISLFPDGGG